MSVCYFFLVAWPSELGMLLKINVCAVLAMIKQMNNKIICFSKKRKTLYNTMIGGEVLFLNVLK